MSTARIHMASMATAMLPGVGLASAQENFAAWGLLQSELPGTFDICPACAGAEGRQ